MSTAIGVDIGSRAVRAVELSSRGRGLASLQRVGEAPLPVGAIDDGEIADPDLVAEALRQLWREHGFRRRQVALGLASQHVIVRLIELPDLPDAELRAALGYQVEDHIPIAVDQAVLDFHVIDRYETDDGEPIARLILVAAQRDTVDAVLSAARRAKLVPTLLDLDAFALVRSLAPAPVLGEHAGELIVDIGAEITNIVVHRAGVPLFVRILVMGGDAITEALVDRAGVSVEEAEQLKAQTGVAPAYQTPAGSDPAAIIAERAERFVAEIAGSLEYYGQQVDAVPAERVVLSGGGSLLRGLGDQLGARLGLPVLSGQPMQELGVSGCGLSHDELLAAQPRLAVAIGLGLGALE